MKFKFYTLLILFSFFSVAALADESIVEKTLAAKFSEPIGSRDHEVNPDGALLFSPAETTDKGRTFVDNTSAYLLQDGRVSREEFSEIFDELLEILGAENFQGQFILREVGIRNHEEKAFIRELKERLKKLMLAAGVPGENIKLSPFYVPKGSGPQRIARELRSFLPLKQDYQNPIPAEWGVGVVMTLLNEISTAAYAVAAFPPEVARPLLGIHFVLLTFITAFRRTVSNWNNRSKSLSSSFLKQALIAGVFIGNYNITAKWPEIMASLQSEGLDKAGPAFVQFAIDQGLTTVVQTVFFWLTFVQGFFKWDSKLSHDKELSLGARRAASALVPIIFFISAPLLLMATTTEEVLLKLGPVNVNSGHLWLSAMAAGGAAFAWYVKHQPEKLTGLIGFVDKVIYKPLGLVNKVTYKPLGFVKRNGISLYRTCEALLRKP